MRISAIDIGTNTVLLLIADVDNGILRPVVHGHAIARLGQGVDGGGIIRPEAMQRVGAVLKEYIKMSRESNASAIVACGTSALRDAKNREAFLEFVRSTYGIEVTVLTGKEEAELTYRGAVSGFTLRSESGYAVVDIGGGSTEVIAGTATEVAKSISLDIGCVRLTERYLTNLPPEPEALGACLAEIGKHTRDIGPIDPSSLFIGVAGTVTTLAAIDLGLDHYDPVRVTGHLLSLERIRDIFDRLRVCTLEELRAIPQIHAGRADILLAGTAILIEIMEWLNQGEILVSDRGLRYGFALREAG